MSNQLEPGLRDPEAPPAPCGEGFTWSDGRLLGFQPMDDLHRAFYGAVHALLRCDESTMCTALDAFEAHARVHFDLEGTWMVSTGFPPRECHIEEHAAVLKSVEEVRQSIVQGCAGVELAHDFARCLAGWFPGHADYLDSALAAWMSKRIFGGQPVVLRRKSG